MQQISDPSAVRPMGQDKGARQRQWGGLLALGALLIALSGAAWAEPAKPSATAGKIGFVTMKRIERESAVGKGLSQRFQEEVSKERQELKELDEEAETTRQAIAKLTPDERKTKEQSLQGKFDGVQQRKVERQRRRKERKESLNREFRRQVAKVIEAVAKEQGLVAVFSRGRGMMYGDQSIDITDAVIERFNADAAKAASSGQPILKP